MIWRLALTDNALRDLARLDPANRQRIIRALERLAAAEYGDVKRLTGRPEWRLRVGDWRVLFIYQRPEEAIRVLRVLHRSSAYRD